MGLPLPGSAVWVLFTCGSSVRQQDVQQSGHFGGVHGVVLTDTPRPLTARPAPSPPGPPPNATPPASRPATPPSQPGPLSATATGWPRISPGRPTTWPGAAATPTPPRHRPRKPTPP